MALLSSKDLAWWQKTVIYEVYPKSFLDTRGQGTGTLKGITQKLDYFEQLGVGVLWITPVYASPMIDNGYDIADYRAIDPRYGTMEDMDELIEAADAHGIKIAMDLVFNHSSDQNAWFLESRSSRDNPKSDWYIWRDPNPDGSLPNNWRAVFGGSVWEWCEERQQYYLHTFAKCQPDLNWENPEVRHALYDVANFWADKGLGGFRIDAISYAKKPEGLPSCPPDTEDGSCFVERASINTPGILDFLHEFKHEVQDGRDIFTLAEAPGVPPEQLDDWVGPKGVFDMLIEFSHVECHEAESRRWVDHEDGWDLRRLKGAITESELNTSHGGWYPIYFDSHDQPRCVNNLLPQPVSDTDAAAKMLATVQYTLRGTPLLYQGQELGYANADIDSIEVYDDVFTKDQYQVALDAGHSPEEALAACQRKSRDNARTPMQWDDSPNAGFTTGTPWLPVHDDYASCNVAAEEADPESVLRWFQQLAALRADDEVLLAGDYEELMADSTQVYAFKRSLGEVPEGQAAPVRTQAVTLANFTEETVFYDPTIVDGMNSIISTHGNAARGMLRPLEAVVYEG